MSDYVKYDAEIYLQNLKIEDDVLEILEKYDTCYLAGGALRGCFGSNEEIIDYDLFFKDTLTPSYVQLHLESKGYEVIFNCPEGRLTTLKKDDVKIQLIKELQYANPRELISTFDIRACCIALHDGLIHTFEKTPEDCKKKEIHFNRIDFPVATFKRIMKYVDKGYTLDNDVIQEYVQNVYDKGSSGEDLSKRFYID